MASAVCPSAWTKRGLRTGAPAATRCIAALTVGARLAVADA